MEPVVISIPRSVGNPPADDNERRLAEALHAGQARLLEMIAKGAPLKDTLDSLMLLIESQSEGLYCSVLLLDEDGIHIHPGSGPNLPPSYMAALEGYAIGPEVGSCGTAMYRKEPVIVTDLLEDPLWAPYKALVEPHGFRACWSTPILLEKNVVLGTFAMYYKEVRSPGPKELELTGVATHIAGIAIERKRREDELDRYHHHLEDLVRQRTAELTAAKEKAEEGMAALSKANQELAGALNSLSIAQEELVRSKKLAALGSLVAGIAHELNTPIGNSLMAVSTLTDHGRTLANSYAKGGGIKRSELESFIGDTNEAGEILLRNLTRAASLIDSFKQVAVDQAGSARRLFLLDEAVAEVLLSLRPALDRNGIFVQQDIPNGLQFDSYPGPLGQVLFNLVNNALVHAFDGRLTGRISVVARPKQEGWVELSVEDDGAGIPAGSLDRIFDPFFTTRLGMGGCGLGLNITHNIVSGVLGGRIGVKSEAGAGATFTLALPLVAPYGN